MPWTYKPPQSFPAVFVQTLREACANPDTPVLLASLADVRDTQAVAERFRYFRWCIRKEPYAHRELSICLENNQIRSKHVIDDFGSHLWITARPASIEEFIRLNPELSDSVLSDSQ